MSIFSKKQDPLEGTMEFSYVIYNAETGDIKTKRYCVPTHTDVVVFQKKFKERYMPDGYELIASPFHRYNSQLRDVYDFVSCGELKVKEMLV